MAFSKQFKPVDGSQVANSMYKPTKKAKVAMMPRVATNKLAARAGVSKMALKPRVVTNKLALKPRIATNKFAARAGVSRTA